MFMYCISLPLLKQVSHIARIIQKQANKNQHGHSVFCLDERVREKWKRNKGKMILLWYYSNQLIKKNNLGWVDSIFWVGLGLETSYQLVELTLALFLVDFLFACYFSCAVCITFEDSFFCVVSKYMCIKLKKINKVKCSK